MNNQANTVWQQEEICYTQNKQSCLNQFNWIYIAPNHKNSSLEGTSQKRVEWNIEKAEQILPLGLANSGDLQA